MSNQKLRVIVTDDSAFMRRAIRRMLEAEPDIEVVGIAHDGQQAIDLAMKHKPDVITMDIEMPVMDGLTALRRIMRQCPTQVLMISSLTSEGSVASLQALRLGAADVIAKDHSTVAGNLDQIRDRLLEVVRGLASSNRFKPEAQAKPKPTTHESPTLNLNAADYDVFAIGSSTGGPPVLETLLTAVPADFPAPILIAQHMPLVFTQSMARRLDDLCALKVLHAEDGMPVRTGQVYIAPGGKHMHLNRRVGQLCVQVNGEPADAIYKPSVTALLQSCAKHTGRRTLAAVLTGIGNDGRDGAVELHKLGATVIAQDEASSVVYGMPRSVAVANAATAQINPDDFAALLKGMGKRAAA